VARGEKDSAATSNASTTFTAPAPLPAAAPALVHHQDKHKHRMKVTAIVIVKYSHLGFICGNLTLNDSLSTLPCNNINNFCT